MPGLWKGTGWIAKIRCSEISPGGRLLCGGEAFRNRAQIENISLRQCGYPGGSGEAGEKTDTGSGGSYSCEGKVRMLLAMYLALYHLLPLYGNTATFIFMERKVYNSFEL